MGADIKQQLIPTIGIECHVQLKTATKLFARVSNDARGADPNTLISPLCVGLPGTLPVLNEAAVELAIRAGVALSAKVNLYSKFDRKHYFYPDLPKGYQITQFDEPIIGYGEIEIALPDGSLKTVRIERAHMEEDAGKSTHPDGADYSLVDLNRAGTPLLEIVSFPDMHTAAEAKAYAKELYLRMKYSDVSEADLYHGNMRFDVNISMAPVDSETLGTRAEIKNLNSFKAVEKAVDYEVARQTELLTKGQAVVQETRGWDDAKQKTFSQRSKEDAHDYRYFPDADLPPIIIEQSRVDEALRNVPLLPPAIRASLKALGLDWSQIDTLVETPPAARLLLAILERSSQLVAIKIANWLTGDIQRAVIDNRFSWDKNTLDAEDLISLAKAVDAGQLSSTGAKKVLEQLMLGKTDVQAIARDNNLIQESDNSVLEVAVDEVLAANPKAAEDVRGGEMKAIGFLVGQIMKATKGTANPQVVQAIIKERLGM